MSVIEKCRRLIANLDETITEKTDLLLVPLELRMDALRRLNALKEEVKLNLSLGVLNDEKIKNLRDDPEQLNNLKLYFNNRPKYESLMLSPEKQINIHRRMLLQYLEVFHLD